MNLHLLISPFILYPTMDFLQFDPTHKVLVCTLYRYALPRNTVNSHLRSAHKDQLSLAEREDCLQIVRTMDLEAPERVKHKSIPPSSPPIPYLTLYFNGIACKLCESQPYVCCNDKSMREHLSQIHRWTSGDKGVGRLKPPRQRVPPQEHLSPTLQPALSPARPFFGATFSDFSL